MSTSKQDENDALAALTKRMDRLCSEMDSVRQENVKLHSRIAQLEKHAPSTVEVEVLRSAQTTKEEEAEAQRQIQQMKDEELARELADLWSSSGDEEQHQSDKAAPLPSSTTAPAPVQGRVSPREAAAAAAEARAQKVAPHMERIAKQEIIGRLQEIYKRQGKEAHWALGSYSLPRLKALLKELV